MHPTLSWLLASTAAVLPFAAPAAAQAEGYRFHFDHVLGTSLDIVAVADSESGARLAAAAARHEIARLDRHLSAWRADSELEALNAAGMIKASPDLHAVLSGCEAWRGKTGGAFDCRVGAPLAQLRNGVMAEPAPTLQAIAFGPGAAVALPAGARVTVDGMAKGYVIDQAMAAARAAVPGLKGLMVDVGGDLACWGQSPAAAGWRVGVAARDEADNVAPAHRLVLKDAALAVSGRGPRDLVVAGKSLSHVIDPASGRPTTHAVSAAVVAPRAADADALSTAFMAMKPERAIALANATPGVEALVVAHDGVEHRSNGWDGLAQPAAYVPAAMGAAAASAVAARPLLDMSYTVPKIDADPYHAPYVVVWITDGSRQMVRTLMILGVKPKWAPENFVWWRRYGRIKPDVIDSVGRATRLPGKYSLQWDGKDDTGKAVKPGQYILHIEASREKGGHTYQTIDLSLPAKGTKTLPAKDEMGAVVLNFGR